MPDHLTRKRWIKLWTQETLHGTTLKELEVPERAVWFELLCLAGDSVIPGHICISEDTAYTNDQLVKILKVPMDLLKTSLAKLQLNGKITLNGDGIIMICNWDKYQAGDRTGYMRDYMRDYRGKKDNINTDVNVNSKQVNSKTSNSKQVGSKQTEQNRGEGRGGEKTIVKDNNINSLSKDNDDKSSSNLKFKELYEILNKCENAGKKIALLVNAFKEYHGDAPTNEFEQDLYGRIGKIVKDSNNRHQLVLKVIIQSSAEHIDGYHLDYIQKTVKGKIKAENRQTKDSKKDYTGGKLGHMVEH